MAVTRYDLGALRPAKRLKDGTLRADAYLTRTGVFEYRNADGSIRRELRTSKEVFDADALESFAMVPVTDDHPPGLLVADTAKEHARGTTGENVRRDGEHVRATIKVFDSATIAAMEAGKRQLSCGYECDLVETPGTDPVFGRYDAIQTNIRGNHVALVDSGRAGPDVAVRLDSGAAVMVGETRADMPEENEIMSNVKIRIDGVEVEVPELAAQLVVKAQTAATAALEAATASATEATKTATEAVAKADAQAAELDAAKAALAEATDESKVRARVDARVALETMARAHLDAAIDLAKMPDLAIKVAIVEALAEVKLDEAKAASPVYVDARLDAELERASKATPHLDAARVAAGAAGPRNDAESAYAEMVNRNRNAWRGQAVKE